MAVLASAILHERPRHCRPSPFCPDVFAVIVNGFVNPAMRGYPPPPGSMKTMELQRRQHQNPRVIRSYTQNLETQGLSAMWMDSHMRYNSSIAL
jgi:hypothetical protein